MSKIVVTGSGRSGTGWCAAILNSAGIRTGHEQVFTPATTGWGTPLDWGNYRADCSWLAVPRLPLLGVKAALVVRNPLVVVESVAHLRFGEHPHVNEFTQVAAAAGMTPDLDGWLRFWLTWNVRAFSQVDAVFTLDQLLANPTTLTRWAGALDEPAETPIVNARDEWKIGYRPVLYWEDFTDTDTVRQAQELWDSLRVLAA